MIRAEYWRRHVTEVHKTQEDILLTKEGFQFSSRMPLRNILSNAVEIGIGHLQSILIKGCF